MEIIAAVEKPIVLCIAAHDPTGGAGIQADIETILANHCLPISVITALTDQSLEKGVKSITPQDPEQFVFQLQSLINQFSIAAIKIGVLGNLDIVQKVIDVLKSTTAPIVYDPVINASSGFNFTNQKIIKLIQKKLLPLSTLITPNGFEAKTLSEQSSITLSAKQLVSTGCQNVLVTSVIEDSKIVEHQLFSSDQVIDYQYPKLEGEYHGSGCTLSSAITSQIALGNSIDKSVKNGLDFTWQSLKHAVIKNNNTYIPNRFYQ